MNSLKTKREYRTVSTVTFVEGNRNPSIVLSFCHDGRNSLVRTGMSLFLLYYSSVFIAAKILANNMNGDSAIHTHIGRKSEAGFALSALGGEHGLNACAHTSKQLDNRRFPLVLLCIETNKW
jgi:hypothetical protein